MDKATLGALLGTPLGRPLGSSGRVSERQVTSKRNGIAEPVNISRPARKAEFLDRP